jgi:hypothetical protein
VSAGAAGSTGDVVLGDDWGNGSAGDVVSGGDWGKGAGGGVVLGGDWLLARMGPKPGGTLGVCAAGVGDGSGSTLVGGAAGVGSVCSGGTLGGSATGVGSACGIGVERRLVRTSARVLSVFVSLSVSGASGEPAEGCWRAWTMSLAPAITKSIDDARGMITCIGNQSRVSQVRSRRVSNAQVW